MIIITGARGFIGSNLVQKLNSENFNRLILVDELQNSAKNENLKDARFIELIDREYFIDWFNTNAINIDFVFHLGARTDTTESDKAIFDKLNLNYSKAIWEVCTKKNIPLVYASSAATYGNGEFGYSDEHDISNLQPLNEYGWSKQNFDLWVQTQHTQPPFWAGLKFFNVYGPNENHKGRMASVIFHAYHQIKESGKLKLFQSHNENYQNGEQLRDFIYIADLVNICLHFYTHQDKSGLYNVGTGTARTFNDLGKAVFNALNAETNIQYIPTPIDIRDKYQYFTEATTEKLTATGYRKEFYSLEKGVEEYLKKYLMKH